MDKDFKVKDLIELLQQVNPDATVEVIASNKSQKFSITYGGGDGCTKTTCESFSFYLDKFNTSEKI